MYCANCGNEVHGKFCTKCGAPVVEAPDESGATHIMQPGDVPEMAPNGPPPSGATEWSSPYSASGVATAPPPDVPPFAADLASRLIVPPGVQQQLAPLEGIGKQYLAWAGCLLLLIGTFVSDKTYSVSVSFLGTSYSGSVSLWDYATFWSLVLLLLIAASAGLAFIRDYKWLLLTGAASFVILVLNLLFAFAGVSSLSAHPSWGWILLLPGALLILAAGATRPTPRDAVDDNGVMNLIGSLRSR